MRILTLADMESKYLWDFFEKSKLEGIDLILSAGDLAHEYLEFLATYSKAPVLYIHGNHDTKYIDDPPLGCICIDDDIYVYNGVRIMGLGGSMCYNYGSFQYTEKDMYMRYLKLKPKLWRRKGIDILLTHAPAYGLNDGTDLPHMGFKCFNKIMDKYEPSLFVHGHVHLNYGREHKREDTYNKTRVINAFERYIVEL
ncbi:MAG: metallophosphoesterase [Eubacterium sp.]|nr:metallophosphoesterase [Eubacterium sp.]